uniref:hypothetical protein n=1 Tax=Isoptericola halotolerans TaxID=300560 RepID=UPI00388D47D7
MKKSVALRSCVATFGAALLVSAGSAALADEDEKGSTGVDLNVEIEELAEPGALALTVASTETTLTEGDSTELERVFTGTLPQVTVTDTRAPEDVPEGAVWTVLGSASDFHDEAQANIVGAQHLGWAPRLVAGEGEGEPFVSVGGDVAPSGPGLVDHELLYLAESAEGNDAGGVFSATADLSLVVPADVAAGVYSSTITLSLFE